jgi:hypothetical protein
MTLVFRSQQLGRTVLPCKCYDIIGGFGSVRRQEDENRGVNPKWELELAVYSQQCERRVNVKANVAKNSSFIHRVDHNDGAMS